jgi:hypothetical protein
VVLNVPGPEAAPFEVLANARERYVGARASGFVRSVFALNEEAECEGLLNDAGFRDVTARAEIRELSLPAPRDFLWQYVASTPLAAIVAAADDDAR